LWGKQAKYIGKIVKPEPSLQVEELKNLRRIEGRAIPYADVEIGRKAAGAVSEGRASRSPHRPLSPTLRPKR
jgi:hypothetical protein